MREWLYNDNVQLEMNNDINGKQLLSKIKFASSAQIAKEMKEIYNEIKDNICDESDTTRAWVIRTKEGNGPVMFMNADFTDNYEGRHRIRRWYAYTNKINYFDVRECTYDYWIDNPETQVATAI